MKGIRHMTNNEPIYLKLEDTTYNAEIVQLQEKIVNSLKDCFLKSHEETAKERDGHIYYRFEGFITENGISISLMLSRRDAPNPIRMHWSIEKTTDLKEDEESFGYYTPWWYCFSNESKCTAQIKSYQEFMDIIKWLIMEFKRIEISSQSTKKLITTLEKIYQEENV